MMPKFQSLKRFASGATVVVAILLGSAVQARQGDQITSIFVGTTTYTDGTATTNGTTFGAKWAWEFQPNLLWTISGQYAATEGQETSSGTKYNLSTNTTTVQTGATYLFNNEPNSVVVGMVGGGLSILWYDLKFDYPGADIGNTSGVGPGVFALLGAEIRLAKNISLIPEYVVSAHQIRTEGGDAFTLVSGGPVVAIRISF
jgi:hypothetical protein